MENKLSLQEILEGFGGKNEEIIYFIGFESIFE